MDARGETGDRPADREALRHLRAQYTHTYDRGDLEAFCALFTEDATLQLGPVGIAVGRDQIRSSLAGVIHALGFVLHFTSDEVTEFTGPDTAVGRCRFAVHVGPEPSCEGAGTYHDTYRRTAGVWRFASRTMEFAYMGPRPGGWPSRPAPPSQP